MSRSRHRAYVDLHAHVLPGVDDGPGTSEDARSLLAAMQAEGATAVVATSHVSARYPNDAGALARARDILDSAPEGLHVTVLPGAEIDMSFALTLPEAALAQLCLGDTRWLLIETPHTRYPSSLPEATRRLRELDFEVLLAHPERNTYLQRDARLLEEAVDAGGAAQLTGASLRGALGRHAQRAAFGMLESGLAHVVATDAHDLQARPPDMSAAVTAVSERYGSRVAEAVSCVGPSALLAGASAAEISGTIGPITRGRRSLARRLFS